MYKISVYGCTIFKKRDAMFKKQNANELRHDCVLQYPFHFITQQLTHYCHYVKHSAHIINSIINKIKKPVISNSIHSIYGFENNLFILLLE